MTKQKKRIVEFLLAITATLMFFSGLFLWSGIHVAFAYDGLPGEFGSIVGGAITDSNGGTYVNYERGYVYYAPNADMSNPTNASAHVGGKNAVKNGSDVTFNLIAADTMTSVKNWETLVDVNSSGNRVAYGSGWNAEAAKKVGVAFKEKWETLIGEGYNLGIPCSNVNLYTGTGDGDAVVFGMEFRYGDSVYDPEDGNGGRKNMSYLMYNVLNDEAYLVSDGFTRLTGEVRRIGAPVSDQISGATVTGWDGEGNSVNVSNATVQVFETGILIGTQTSDGKVTYAEKHEGVIEKISGTEYKIYPFINDQDILAKGGNKITANGVSLGFIGDVDGTWHALRTARVVSHEDGKMKVEFNFRAGCIEVVYNDEYSLYSRMAYAGQNFVYDENGDSARVTLPAENFTTDEHLWESVESGALAMYQSLSGNAGASEDNMKADFRAAYMRLLEDGVIPGYRCSSIKIWTILCVDYKYSPDSRYGFDGMGSAARERMYTLVYSGVQKKVYGVGDDFWNLWREDNVRPALGAPISNAMSNVTISGITFSRIQIFEQGYIYENDKGSLVVEYGATTDSEYKNFIYTVAPPEKPSQYGNEIERFTVTENNRLVVYVNYEKGAVKATEMYTKTGYLYDYYPGRNFIGQGGTYQAKLLSFDLLYDINAFTCASSYNDIFNDHEDEDGNFISGAKTQIIEKIQSLLEKGFFPGFSEGTFEAWNGVACQQFIYGDSTALPWGGDARTNVCALVWNDSLGKVILLKDAFMELWGGTDAYTLLGAPAGDEFTIDDSGTMFQYFYGTAAQNNKAFAVSVGYNEATYFTPNNTLAETVNPAWYLAQLEQLSTPLSGVTVKKPENNTVAVGSYTMLEYSVEGASADATIEITSSDESIAMVMADGSVEFYKTGTVTVTVSVSDGVNTYTDSVTYKVVKNNSNAAGTISDENILNTVLPIVGSSALLIAACVILSVKFRKRESR